MHKTKLLIQFVIGSTIFAATQLHANSTVSGPANPTQQTAGANNNTLEILGGNAPTAGQIIAAVNTNGVNINSIGGTVLVDPNNVPYNLNTIVTSGTGVGINFAANSGTLNVGAFSGINSTGTGDAVYVNAPSGTITNAGTIASNGTASAIEILLPGTNATVTNQAGGTITNAAAATAPSFKADNDTSGLTLSNAGTIQSLAAVDAVQVLGSFISISNNSGGLIQQNNAGIGNAITIGGTASTGTITNNQNATITVTGTGSAIDILNGITLTGPITNSGTMTTASGTTILVAGILQGGLINSGTITNTTIGNTAIDLSAAANGAFTQEGGLVQGNVLLAQGDNTGSSQGMVFTMTGGQIKGNVLAANAQTQTFTLDGGTITGNLSAAGNTSTDTFYLYGTTVTGNVQLGAAGDTVNLQGSNLNLLTGGAAADTFNIYWGNFNVLDGNGGIDIINIDHSWRQTGVIQNSAVGGLLTISVNNDAVYIADNTVSNVESLTLTSGSTMDANSVVNMSAGISGGANVIVNEGGLLWALFNTTGGSTFNFAGAGSLENFGTTEIGHRGNLYINAPGAGTQGIFTNEVGSELIIKIAGYPSAGATGLQNGHMIVTDTASQSVNLMAGSAIAPKFTGFIPNDSVFDVITVNGGGTITNNAGVLQSSAVVFFNPSINASSDVLSLTAERNPYSSLVNYPALGVANTLDWLTREVITTNNDLFTVITQLDQLQTAHEVNAALNTLVPEFNYGIVAGSHIGMDNVFEGVTDRVWDIVWRGVAGRRHLDWLAQMRRKQQQQQKQGAGGYTPQAGMNYGSYVNQSGVWLRPMGAYVNQSMILGVNGYTAKGWGGTIGTDFGINNCIAFGGALSYTHVDVEGKGITPKDDEINSWMATIYSSFDFNYGIFLDGMLAYAFNHYETNRVISVGNLNTAADAAFTGNQWGAQFDLGMAIPDVGFLFAPFVRLKYITVGFDAYRETGAGDLNLTVASNDADEFLAGIGLRMAGNIKSDNRIYIPEIMGLLAYDIDNDGQVTLANFIGGGPAFTTNGVTPGRLIFDLGFALNIFASPCAIATFKYNAELRDFYIGHSGYAQYFYSWG